MDWTIINRAPALNLSNLGLVMAKIREPFRLNYPNQESMKGVVVASAAKNSHLAETKQQQIVNSASEIFFEKGFHPTTVRMVAKASGMSMGQLYHYISSKDDVLYLVHKNVYRGLYEHILKAGFERVEDPLERLLVALRLTLEFITEDKKRVQFAYSESKYLDKKYLRVVLEMYRQNTICFWRQLLDELDKRKPIGVDLDFAASFIAHQTVFLALSGWTLKDKPVGKSINLLIKFIIKGLGL